MNLIKKFNLILPFLSVISVIIFFAERFSSLNSFAWYARGYDFGFYLYELKTPNGHSWLSSLAGLSGSFNTPLFFLNRFLHFKPETFLLLLSTFCGLALLASWFYYFRDSVKTAVFAAIITAVSLVQQEASQIFLLKTLLALPVMIFGLAFLKDKKWARALSCAVLLIIFHRTTAIFFLLAGFGYIIVLQIQAKSWTRLILEFLIAGGAAIFCWQYFYGQEIVKQIFNDYNPFVRGGIFLGSHGLLTALWPFWAAGSISAFFYLKNRQPPLPVVLAGITVFWIVFHFPFYRRAAIYLDIAGIIFIAYGLTLINFNKWRNGVLAGLALILLGAYTFNFLSRQSPLITAPQAEEIKTFKTKNSGEFVLAVDANDAPWLLGFLKDSRLGAPGLFEDRNSYAEWQNFWYGRNQTQFLWRYPRPLYIYQRGYFVPGPVTNCFFPLSAHFSEYVCKN